MLKDNSLSLSFLSKTVDVTAMFNCHKLYYTNMLIKQYAMVVNLFDYIMLFVLLMLVIAQMPQPRQRIIQHCTEVLCNELFKAYVFKL